MEKSERDRIKKKVLSYSPQSWNADPFDVRYYLASKIKSITGKKVLDVGGGSGVLSSELSEDNFKVLFDLSIDKLKKCQHIDSKINVICASFTHMPFKEGIFEVVISTHTIELAKLLDIKEGKEKKLPNMINYLKEIKRVMSVGELFLTTPNNAYHKGTRPEYEELKRLLDEFFPNNKIWFFNTGKKLSKHRKLDLSNVVPKLKSKIQNPDDIINNMISEKSKNNYSRYFFVKAIK
jgi:ubiquinone/menaquinone biosynthesis C-methylase UbiE